MMLLRLFNVDDTSLIDQMSAVQKLAEQKVNNQRVVPERQDDVIETVENTLEGTGNNVGSVKGYLHVLTSKKIRTPMGNV